MLKGSIGDLARRAELFAGYTATNGTLRSTADAFRKAGNYFVIENEFTGVVICKWHPGLTLELRLHSALGKATQISRLLNDCVVQSKIGKNLIELQYVRLGTKRRVICRICCNEWNFPQINCECHL